MARAAKAERQCRAQAAEARSEHTPRNACKRVLQKQMRFISSSLNCDASCVGGQGAPDLTVPRKSFVREGYRSGGLESRGALGLSGPRPLSAMIDWMGRRTSQHATPLRITICEPSAPFSQRAAPGRGAPASKAIRVERNRFRCQTRECCRSRKSRTCQRNPAYRRQDP